MELNENFEEAINKLKKIVKAFHGTSNVRGHQLQETIKAWQKYCQPAEPSANKVMGNKGIVRYNLKHIPGCPL